MTLNSDYSRIQTHFAFLAVILCMILNHSHLSDLLITAVIGVLSILNLTAEALIQKRVIQVLVIISFIISGVSGLANGVSMVNIQRYAAIMLLLCSFPYTICWNNRLHFFLLLSAGLYLFLMQTGMAFGVDLIQQFADRTYPLENNQWGEEAILLSNLGEYTQRSSFLRYGGVFYNPNTMGQTMVFWYVIMRNFKYVPQRAILAVFAIGFVSILMSGSRTAFVVFLLYNITLYWRLILKNKALITSFMLVLLLALFFLPQNVTGFRIFNITQGVTSTQGSGTIKYRLFIDWINQELSPAFFNLKNFLIGTLNWQVEFDNDPGYVLSFFGFGGSLLLLCFFVDTFFHSTRFSKNNFWLFFIGIGATIIMNFRFSIFEFLILSEGYRFVRDKRSIYIPPAIHGINSVKKTQVIE